VSAALQFSKLYEKKSEFDWDNNPLWNKRGGWAPLLPDGPILVDLVYLGTKPTHKLLAAISSADNSTNDASYGTNFYDAAEQVYMLV